MLEAGFGGSSFSGRPEELFLCLGSANKVLLMAQGVVMVWDTHGTALDMANEPDTGVGSTFGEDCNYFPDEAKSWRFLKFCPSTCWVEDLDNALAAGLISFRGYTGGWSRNPKKPQNMKRMKSHETHEL